MTPADSIPPAGPGSLPTPETAITPAKVFLPTSVRNDRISPAAQQMSLSGLLKALRRRWLLAAIVGIFLGAAGALAAWLFVPVPHDSVQAMYIVAAAPPRIMYPTSEQQPDSDGYKRMQVLIVKDRLLLNAAIRNPKVADLDSIREKADPVAWLEKTLQVDFNKGPELMTIALTGDRIDDYKAILEAIKETYKSDYLNKDRDTRLGRKEVIEQLASKFELEITDLKRKLKVEAEASGSASPATLGFRERLALQEQMSLQADALQVKNELTHLKIRQDAKIGKQPKDLSVPDRLVDDEVNKDKQLIDFMSRRKNLETYLAEKMKVFNQPEKLQMVQDVKVELASIDKEIDEYRPRLRKLVNEKMRSRLLGEYEVQSISEKDNRAYLEHMEAELEKAIAKSEKDHVGFGKAETSVTDYNKEISYKESFYRTLRSELTMLDIEQKAPPRIREWGAEVRVVKAEPLRTRILASTTAGLGGVAMVAFTIAWWEFRRRRIDSVEEVVRSLGLDLVGTVPGWSRSAFGRSSAYGQADHRWQSLLQESVDSTRTMLLHAAQEQKLRIVMITSAVGSEGKTSLSCHLAASMARGGQRTLLIDWDLRNPSTHRLFDVPRSPGLADILRGTLSVAEAIRATPAEGLWILPAGNCDGVAIRALAQDKPRQILEEVRPQFDMIIVDSCPVLPVADSLLVGQHVDAVLLSVLQDVSQMPHVHAAYQKITALGIRILGAVVNGTTDQVYGNKYAYYHYANYQEHLDEEANGVVVGNGKQQS